MRTNWLVTTALAVVTSLSCNTAAIAPASTAPSSPIRLASMPTVSLAPISPGLTAPPPLTVTASGQPLDAPPRGTIVFGGTQQFPFDGDVQSDFSVFPDAVVWSSGAWRPTQPPLRPGAGRILELSLATGQVRTLYTAPSENTFVTVKASSEWLTWLEGTDAFGLKDARLFVMPRRGGVPVVVDDVRRYTATVSFLMWCIDGPDLYWTVPELRNGRPVGDLKHKRLPDGPTEVLVSAQPGQIIALPSAYQGVLAYEVRGDTEDARVVVRLPDGTTRSVGTAPASEPAVGSGFVAYKQANVAQAGSLAAMFLADGRVVNLGSGEAPRAGGSWLAWGSWLRDPQDPSSTSPVFVSDPALGCIARFKRPLPSTNSSISIPAISGGRAVWMLSDFDKSQLDRQTLVVDELQNLHC